jgi:RNA polymerase sigma-70 factor (ECF subfamily)
LHTGAVADGDDQVLEAHLRAGREAWPDIDVDAAAFASDVRRRAKDAPLASLKGADLYIAIACGAGNARAVAAVRTMLEREVAYASSKTTATRDQIAEVTAIVSKQLFADGVLGDYSGRGHLKGYLSVIATRELFRHINKARREVGIEDAAVLDRIVPQSDPELSILRAQYREIVDDAMRAAIRTLDDRGRALLRYAVVDGWTVAKVGKLYNVHGATAARWIASVREQLGETIREELSERLEVSVDEVDSIVRLVQSRIDVSLDRMLGKP